MKTKLYGALLGDCIGSPYEFNNYKGKDFQLFDENRSFFTDDSVMTIAIAEALLDHPLISMRYGIVPVFAKYMQKWGKMYPDAGYGGRFYEWLYKEHPTPYNSWGNGAAMRVSAVGWFYDSLDTTRRVAVFTALPTHNHPEGIKGAEATASAIFLARNGFSKDVIKEFTEKYFGYELNKSCDEIRPDYEFNESCQDTVPQAITAFLEGNDFEDVMRTAVSLGGDSDTLACIAGSIAEAFFGVPEDLVDLCNKQLEFQAPAMMKVLKRFNALS